MAWYSFGSMLAGTALGLAVGAAGQGLRALFDPEARHVLIALGAAGMVGLLLEANAFGWRIPSVRRQVNDMWLYEFRGWLYGFGFGIQLGAGVVTIVNSWATYWFYLWILAIGSPETGAVLGLLHGFARAATLLPAYRIQTPEQLFAMQRRLTLLNSLSRRGSLMAGLVLSLATFVLAVA